jgi:anti-sigma B factor antagonist
MPDEPDPLLSTDGLQLPMEVDAFGEDLVSVTLRGDVDLSEAGELRAVLNDACTGPHRTVAVDLSAVHFMGSTAIGVLAEVHLRLAGEGRRLLVIDPSEPIRQAFAITGLDHVLHEGPKAR